MANKPLISVVDDDVSVRESLLDLLLVIGYACTAFATAKAFLESDSLDLADCVVLDIAMPYMTGPELHAELKRQGRSIPIVYITAHADDVTCQRLLEQGAVACLLKPFTERALLNALNSAVGRVDH